MILIIVMVLMLDIEAQSRQTIFKVNSTKFSLVDQYLKYNAHGQGEEIREECS